MKNTEKATLYLSFDTYTSKPKGIVVGGIQKSILSNKVTVDPKELAEEVAVNGRAVKLCNLPDGAKNLKNTPIINQSVLMVDIDNENTEVEILTIEKALDNDFVKQNAAFMYETFSSTIEKPKFRIVFFLDNPLLKNTHVEEMYEDLIGLFPQSDSKCKETTRLFFGSNKGFIVVNWNNKLEHKKFFSNVEDREEPVNYEIIEKRKSFVNNSITNNQPFVYNLLYTKDIKKVKIAIKNKELDYYGKSFDTIEDFKQFLLLDTSVSMSELLDLPYSNPFIDIFHDEIEPSVGIYRKELGNLKGIELYNCFSNSHPFIGNIIQVISKLTNLNLFDSLLLLKDILDIKIINEKEYIKIQKIKDQTLEFMELLKTNKLQKSYPNLYKVLKIYDMPIYYLLEMFIEGQVYLNPVKCKYEIYNNISLNRIGIKLSEDGFGYRLDKNKIYAIIKLLTLLGILSKKTDSELPRWLKDNIYTYKSLNKQAFRLDVYTLESSSRYRLKLMDKICVKLIEDKVNISKLDYDYIYNNFNKATADRTFITNTSEKREVSDKLQYIEQTAVKLIINALDSKKYIDEKTLIKRLQNNINRNPELPNLTRRDIQECLIKCRKSICEKYNILVVNLTKINKEKYKIKDVPSNKRPTVYMLDN